MPAEVLRGAALAFTERHHHRLINRVAMAACSLLNFMNMYDVDLTARELSLFTWLTNHRSLALKQPAGHAVTALCTWSLQLH